MNQLVRWSLCAIVLGVSVGCSGLKPITLPFDSLKDPGFFDVGAGYGYIPDTRGTTDDDASGVLVSFKAYPGGRWYAEPQDEVVRKKALTKQERGAIITMLAETSPDRAARPGAGPAPAPTPIQAAQGTLNLLLNAGAKALGKEEEELLTKLVGSDPLSQEERDDLLGLASKEVAASKKWRVVEERCDWYYRFSVFYGLAVSNFNGGGEVENVNVIGIGYDVSPELSLMTGVSFYEVDDGGGSDTDRSWYIGVSLNLFAYKDFLSSISGLAD